MPTLVDDLVPLVDDLRGLHTTFGTRPYTVHLVRTKWSGGDRGSGTESVTSDLAITPTPLVSETDALTQVFSPVGRGEQGDLTIGEISLTYTEAQLLPRDVAVDEQFFYEVRETTGVRRRLFPTSAPYRNTSQMGWTIRVGVQDQGRQASGLPWGR